MQLRLVRTDFTDISTIGDLYVDEVWECYTLEDKVRDVKVADRTAIPEGTYDIVLNWSARFKRVMPLLVGVPGFVGIRIHSGNVAEDTSGCILVGQQKSENRITQSKLAFASLFFKLEMANRLEKIQIAVTREVL